MDLDYWHRWEIIILNSNEWMEPRSSSGQQISDSPASGHVKLWPCRPVTLLVAVQLQSGPCSTEECWHPESLQTLPDRILWLQWTLWHSLGRPCTGCYFSTEILPARWGLPFRDLSDSRRGWEQQDGLGREFWGNSFPPLLLSIDMRPFNEISLNREGQPL